MSVLNLLDVNFISIISMNPFTQKSFALKSCQVKQVAIYWHPNVLEKK